MGETKLVQRETAWRSLPDGLERLQSLLEIYRTALEQLRTWGQPRTAGLIVSLETLYAAAAKDLRYLQTSQRNDPSTLLTTQEPQR